MEWQRRSGEERCRPARRIGEWVDRNVGHARRLYEPCAGGGEFAPAAEPRMSAICIRDRGLEGDEARSARLHAEVARRIERGGRFWISTTVLKGRTDFRVDPVNFRTRTEHVDGLFDLLRRECVAVAEAMDAGEDGAVPDGPGLPDRIA